MSPDRRTPDLLRPMLATAGELPGPQVEQAWAFEMKWDGVRAVVYTGDGPVRVMTRNDREVAVTYPELARVAGLLGGREAVVDGEIVALDGAGRPDFGLLQQRMHVVGAAAVRGLVERVPVAYLAFDLLRLDGAELIHLPYAQRREQLESLGLEGPGVAVPPAFAGNGAAALAASQQRDLEGVVAKRRDSRYEPGRRSRDWLKVKHVRMQEVVVGGWRPGSGNRQGRIGSLLMGLPGPSGLTYIGHVGTGFTEVMLADLAGRLRPLERPTSPFATDLPRVDARDAVWRGLRADKEPAEVQRED
jgi:bifunctional non-homologous end joining protein LigD